MIEINPAEIENIIRHVSATEVMPRFKTLQQNEVWEKSPGDYVTVADEASERALTRLLSEELPGSLVVGEEAVSKDMRVLERFAEGRPVWIVDPIDGTYNFLHGRSKFGMLVALVQNGAVQYGWAYDVPGDRMAFAKRGGGAFLDGKPFRIMCDTKDLNEMIGQAGGAQAWHFEPVLPYLKSIVNLRCSLHNFMNFYTGDADFVVQINGIKPWDHAAVCLIAEEAGAYVAVDDGKPYDNPGFMGPAFLLATPSRECWERLYPLLHKKLIKKRSSSRPV
jgi:fructose-1,6-bisphosphatase/inositol monophosphatase family enzyme